MIRIKIAQLQNSRFGLPLLAKASRYHANNWPQAKKMVTRRVNEAATVHAQSLIRTASYPDLLR